MEIHRSQLASIGNKEDKKEPPQNTYYFDKKWSKKNLSILLESFRIDKLFEICRHDENL